MLLCYNTININTNSLFIISFKCIYKHDNQYTYNEIHNYSIEHIQFSI